MLELLGLHFHHPGPKLQELYLRKNEIADISEVLFLRSCKSLRILWLNENPCSFEPSYRQKVLSVLTNLQKLDDLDVTFEERNNAIQSPFANQLEYMFRKNHNSIVDDYQHTPPVGASPPVFGPEKNELSVDEYPVAKPSKGGRLSRTPPREKSKPSQLSVPEDEELVPPIVQKNLQIELKHQGKRSKWSPADVNPLHQAAQHMKDDETYVYDAAKQNGEIERLKASVEQIVKQQQQMQEYLAPRSPKSKKHEPLFAPQPYPSSNVEKPVNRANLLNAVLVILPELDKERLLQLKKEIERL